MTISDAAKRVSDAYNLHRVSDPIGSIGKWLHVKLEDGTGGNTLFDSKVEAERDTGHMEMYYAFPQVGPWPMTPELAETFLHLHRRMYENNLKMADPDAAGGGHEMIRRTSREDQFNQVRNLFQGDRLPSNIILPGSLEWR